jgi:hypothetical protein
MLSRFQKVQHLSPNESWLLVQALVLLPLTFCGVYVLGVTRWQRVLTRLASLGTTSIRLPNGSIVRGRGAAAIESAGIVARMVKIAAEHGVYQANCLQQTLVLWCLLRRNQIEGEIRFGARKDAGQLQAHAWVECFGIALNEDSDVCRHFSPFEGVAVTAQSET